MRKVFVIAQRVAKYFGYSCKKNLLPRIFKNRDIFFRNGPTPASFLFIFCSFTEKTVDVSRIQTRIVGVEGEHAYLLTTTAITLFTNIFILFTHSWMRFLVLSSSALISTIPLLHLKQKINVCCH